MHPIMNRTASERGAVLVQAAIVLLVLIAFTTFVFDHGVLWVARNQAQTAADAGALAGAIALAFDDTTYPPSIHPDRVKLSAAYTALCASGSSSCPGTPTAANPVWGAQSSAASAVDVLFECPPGYSGRCIRVNVYRNGQSGTVIPGPSWMLPTFFGPLLGLQSPTAAGSFANGQGVKATASARVDPANAADCLRPFAIPDLWVEHSVPTNTVFNVGTDVYVSPTASDPGTGYVAKLSPAGQVGMDLVLKSDANISPGAYRLLDLVGGTGGGASSLAANIETCTADVYGIGDNLGPHLQNGNEASLDDAVWALWLLDPTAEWDDYEQKIINSCVDTHTCQKYVWDAASKKVTGPYDDPTATISPRVIALPIYNPAKQAADSSDVEIVNFLGFFISYYDYDDKGVHGIVTLKPGGGQKREGGAEVGAASAFMNVIQLVR